MNCITKQLSNRKDYASNHISCATATASLQPFRESMESRINFKSSQGRGLTEMEYFAEDLSQIVEGYVKIFFYKMPVRPV